MQLSKLDKAIWVLIIFSVGLCAWLSVIYNTNKINGSYTQQINQECSGCSCKKNKSKI